MKALAKALWYVLLGFLAMFFFVNFPAGLFCVIVLYFIGAAIAGKKE